MLQSRRNRHRLPLSRLTRLSLDGVRNAPNGEWVTVHMRRIGEVEPPSSGRSWGRLSRSSVRWLPLTTAAVNREPQFEQRSGDFITRQRSSVATFAYWGVLGLVILVSL